MIGIACTAWVAGWAWYLAPKAGPYDDVGPHQADLKSELFIGGDTISLQNGPTFPFSGASPDLPPDFQQAAESIQQYLQNNPRLRLHIAGIFSAQERNLTPSQNLGLARAESLKLQLVNRGVAVGQIATAGMESSNLVVANGKVLNGLLLRFDSLQIVDNQEVVSKNKIAENKVGSTPKGVSAEAKTFAYRAGEYRLDKKNIPALEKIRKQLKADPTLILSLTGYSGQEEEAASKYNLAEIRALMVRRYLVDHGIRRSQIEVGAKPGMALQPSEQIVLLNLRK